MPYEGSGAETEGERGRGYCSSELDEGKGGAETEGERGRGYCSSEHDCGGKLKCLLVCNPNSSSSISLMSVGVFVLEFKSSEQGDWSDSF